MPWLNIPPEHQAVFIAPLHPRGGLLGGSSDGAPKLSKLQALAAARKKKSQEQKSNGASGVEKPMATLSLADQSQEKDKFDRPETARSTSSAKQPSRGFPLRKRKNSDPHEKLHKPSSNTKQVSDASDQASTSFSPILELDQAEPSAFASTMFNSRDNSSPNASINLFTLPYTASQTPPAANPFAGPSPDDVVIAAQSKGSTKFRSS
jgi:elongation factor 1 alpha-like protein